MSLKTSDLGRIVTKVQSFRTMRKSSDLKQLNGKRLTTYGNLNRSRTCENHLQSCA